MTTSNPSQLALLSDHIKLSLLERARAQSLNLSPNTQNAELSRSLDSFREGLQALEASHASNPPSTAAATQAAQLRQQYADLLHQFDGSSPAPSNSAANPNSDALKSDFARAQQRAPTSSLKRQNSGPGTKSVRFTDSPDDGAADAANRAALMPYTDDPDQAPDHGALDNQQIHQYHSRVMREQDEQLDALGASVRRQGELSIQIGDELDEQSAMLDDVDEGVTRHQSSIDRARGRVGRIARRAKDNWSMLTIAILVIILILLIVVLK